ncbi:YbaB/EbfC family nucleoid-associated protein [Streptomyces sp. WAC06614]|uniref:YbaB/EbfC family nucleoid-associated protein n=1 Tax=Streptomyces sp. WAC06614 TaxID=2487416 RepID=UPI000F76C33E|nr:YbaB/EbfC family nucleoid-associated protein [Streptomyces sp. WAC06614]RSS54716.1 YbaB/EbfC family DNA-binding protein [Streptomyces sp. WAC06614]
MGDGKAAGFPPGDPAGNPFGEPFGESFAESLGDPLGGSLEDQIEQAMARLGAHRARIEKAGAALRRASATVTSKDRLLTVKVGPQGEVLAVTFHTDDYQRMAPAQLGELLKDVLNEARAEIGEQITATFREFEGLGDALRTSMSGGTTLDDILAPLREMRPKGPDPVNGLRLRRPSDDGFADE